MGSNPLNWGIDPKKRYERDLKKVDEITHKRVIALVKELSESEDP